MLKNHHLNEHFFPLSNYTIKTSLFMDDYKINNLQNYLNISHINFHSKILIFNTKINQKRPIWHANLTRLHGIHSAPFIGFLHFEWVFWSIIHETNLYLTHRIHFWGPWIPKGLSLGAQIAWFEGPPSGTHSDCS